MSYVIEPRDRGFTNDGRLDLVVTGEWSEDAREALEQGQADGLVLNYARGFRQQPIDFIRGLPIRRFNLLARAVDDLSPVYSLESLEELRVTSAPRSVIDLARLPELRVLAASWPQIKKTIESVPRLEHLAVSSYKEHDLRPLEVLSELDALRMVQYPNLRSLDGVEAFRLRAGYLSIGLARYLEDITALERAAPQELHELEFSTCKRVVDIGPVASCPSLKVFELSEGGEIPTVAPLAGLVDLERLYLYGRTRVTDGDLTPIANLPKLIELRMVNRPHYRPSADEIEARLRSIHGELPVPPISMPSWLVWTEAGYVVDEGG